MGETERDQEKERERDCKRDAVVGLQHSLGTAVI